MYGIPRINANPAEQQLANFMTATNAYAKQLRENGHEADILLAKNAKKVYQDLIAASIALADPGHSEHNAVFNSFRSKFDGAMAPVDILREIGVRYRDNVFAIAKNAKARGMSDEGSVAYAMNSIAGNPVYDHFGNLNLLAAQMYEEMVLVDSFQGSGDAFAVPTEAGGTGMDKTRFRAPVEQVTGSAKIMQGDLNPRSMLMEDHNRTQLNFSNEFKNAITIGQIFSLSQAMRDQYLGYESAVAPALAGIILQNRYFQAFQKQDMKLAELMFAFGMDAAGNYIPGVGGSYGLLSSAIKLQLASYNAESPLAAQGSDWLANPTRLIQWIQNYNYQPTNVAAGLDLSVDPSLMYKDIVRLFQMIARQNVNFAPTHWALYVPTDWYGLAMQYPGTQSGSTGTGTFNKQLNEMVLSAVGGKIVNKIEILPSSLCNYGAGDGMGNTNAYNYMIAVAQGCPQENKPVIMPGRTAVPFVTSESVSAQLMTFRSQYPFGGPMVMQHGGCFVMEFSKQKA